jgi:Reverse transcriptase (RNA-dependent DNA polymerase)
VVLADIISDSQSAFIKNRYILDNVITTHEVLHHVHKHKESSILFKVDFQKTFDFVNWGYLFILFNSEVLVLYGFLGCKNHYRGHVYIY